MLTVEKVRWRRTDESDYLHHCPNHLDLKIIYARIYTSRQSYEFSETNQLIKNFKISPKDKSSRLHYKNQAVQKFASEVITIFEKILESDETYFLLPIPPSKSKSHPEYDDRVEQVTNLISQNFTNVINFPVVYTRYDTESCHSYSGNRNPQKIYESLAIDLDLAGKHEVENNIIIVIDDVLTSGAHFTAVRRLLLENFPKATIKGLFWAKSINP